MYFRLQAGSFAISAAMPFLFAPVPTRMVEPPPPGELVPAIRTAKLVFPLQPIQSGLDHVGHLKRHPKKPK